MLKIYLSSICLLFCTCFLTAQTDEIYLPVYNGQQIFHSSNTITVNNNIYIKFVDLNPTTNFYTYGQTELYLYGGLQTSAGTMQGAPDISNTAAMPVFSLTADDTDTNIGPNSYELTINLSSWYSGVPDGETVTKFNFYIRNGLGSTGENITTMISIDLKDAVKDSTLDIGKSQLAQSLKVVKNELIFNNYSGKIAVSAYNLSGQIVDRFEGLANSSRMSVFMALPKNQVSILVVENENSKKTIKTINH